MMAALCGSSTAKEQIEIELRQRIAHLEAENEQLLATIRETQNPEEQKKGVLEAHDEIGIPEAGALTIIVLGASGDLAKKKTFPALFSLFKAGLLPPRATICGFARSAMTAEQFETYLRNCLPKDSPEHVDAFVKQGVYYAGKYDEETSFAELNTLLLGVEERRGGAPANRLYYFAIPPFTFAGAAAAISKRGMSKTGWSRMVLEKPFGSDLHTYNELAKAVSAAFAESQMYRIDHYLGKEMVQNLMSLRFANTVFEPIWNNQHIASVQITFKEDIGTDGRGGYFDAYGIIRDVMQNHLFQMLAIVAMEPPVSASAEDVRDEKVKVLKAMAPLQVSDLVIGQYTKSEDGSKPGYLDDATVPPGSQCPTYAALVTFINNRRWNGVPFILKCGKALDARKAEIRIQMKPIPGNLFGGSAPNELVLRVQPDEAVYLKITAKVPGLTMETAQTELDLSYHKRYKDTRLPEAYERLILDVLRGDHSLFVRHDELFSAWSLFTPLLHKLAEDKVQPFPYVRGSRGPKEADDLIAKYYVRTEGYKWQPSHL